MKHKLMLLSASTLAMLILLECLFRILKVLPAEANSFGHYRLVENKRIFYGFIPGAMVDGSRINLQGYKDRDFIEFKPPYLVRIAMLGDSITQGMGVPLEKTFSDILEAKLNEEAAEQKSAQRYEVMNFGVTAYNLEAEIETLRTQAVLYAPDIVVLNYYYNDTNPNVFMLNCGFRLDKAQKLAIIRRYYFYDYPLQVRFIHEKVFSRSKLYLFLCYALNEIRFSKSNPDKLFDGIYKKNGSRGSVYDVALPLLQELRALGEKHHFGILVCIHSFLLLREHPHNAFFIEAVEKVGFPHFRMYPYYKKQFPAADNAVIGFNHCHPNELGHRVIAQAMLEELKRNRLIGLK